MPLIALLYDYGKTINLAGHEGCVRTRQDVSSYKYVPPSHPQTQQLIKFCERKDLKRFFLLLFAFIDISRKYITPYFKSFSLSAMGSTSSNTIYSSMQTFPEDECCFVPWFPSKSSVCFENAVVEDSLICMKKHCSQFRNLFDCVSDQQTSLLLHRRTKNNAVDCK